MSTTPRFASHAEAKKAGWFSRRHETNKEHREAQDKYRIKRELRKERELAALKPVTQ